MNRGILFATSAALIGSTAMQACRRTAAPEQIAVVDSLRTVLEAAALTLNELDLRNYSSADSILRVSQPLFRARFADTLQRPVATKLVEQFMVLREAERMAFDHRSVHAAVDEAFLRSSALRNDLMNGAIPPEEGTDLLRTEQQRAAELDPLVRTVLTNYRSIQSALERQPRVDSLLADTVVQRTHR